ncbi:MAG: dihydrofolate reductase family protein [Salibacteraceae bacterium]
MGKLVYQVACSLDGFIGHSNGSFDGFLMDGPHASAFYESLNAFNTVLMGRKTYTFGYAYGLQPGEAPYPNMRNVVFSRSLSLPDGAQVEVVNRSAASFVADLKQNNGGPIWLCGGGDLASQLLSANLIDECWLKLNPILLGKGIPAFGAVEALHSLQLMSTESYTNGVVLLKYAIQNVKTEPIQE